VEASSRVSPDAEGIGRLEVSAHRNNGYSPSHSASKCVKCVPYFRDLLDKLQPGTSDKTDEEIEALFSDPVARNFVEARRKAKQAEEKLGIQPENRWRERDERWVEAEMLWVAEPN
jgi:hypothetical protein